MSVRQAPYSFTIGTRSAVFVPAQQLGLVIIEEEEHFAYRQDQVPHYRAAEVALARTKESGGRLVFGSTTPSLETYVFCKNISTFQIPAVSPPAKVRPIDLSRAPGFKTRPSAISKILEHRMAEVLEQKGRMLIFGPQKAFSTFLYCQKCKSCLTCPRCSSSLRYFFKEKQLACPSCAFKMPPQELCPRCHSAYIKYSGFGLEKLESEIARLFPTSRITTYRPDLESTAEYDIMLATQDFLENPCLNKYTFLSIAVLGFEQMLGHVDFRSTERAFSRLWKLASLAKNDILIQTQTPDHYPLAYLAEHNAVSFYEHELGLRQELGLPPSLNLATVLVRGKNQNKTKDTAELFYQKLKKTAHRLSHLEIYEPVAAIPLKKRGNYWYHILIKYKELEPLRKTIWSILKDRKKGVIATFDPLT